jgi:hypothetical protein
MSSVIGKNVTICKMKTKIIFCLLSFFFYLNTNAQCAMCRAVLESEEGQTAAEGMNDGIVYLMVIPYILVAGIGYAIYRKFYRIKPKSN